MALRLNGTVYRVAAVTSFRGIFYFPTSEAARAYAVTIGAPTDRILQFVRGWAIQFHTSGPYVGPDVLTHAGCRFCTPKSDEELADIHAEWDGNRGGS